MMIYFSVKFRKNQGKIQQSAVELVLQVLGVAAYNIQPDAGVVFFQLIKHLCDAVHGVGFSRADIQAAGDLVFDPRDLALRQLHKLHHFAGSFAKYQALLGQLDTSFASDKQRCSQLVLQIL